MSFRSLQWEILITQLQALNKVSYSSITAPIFSEAHLQMCAKNVKIMTDWQFSCFGFFSSYHEHYCFAEGYTYTTPFHNYFFKSIGCRQPLQLLMLIYQWGHAFGYRRRLSHRIRTQHYLM